MDFYLLFFVFYNSPDIHVSYDQANDADVDDRLQMQTASPNSDSSYALQRLAESSNPGPSLESGEKSSIAAHVQINVQKKISDYTPLDDRGAKQCNYAITKFLATGMQPYSLVDDEPFRQMVKTLNPRYTMPGRKYFSNTAVPKLYLE